MVEMTPTINLDPFVNPNRLINEFDLMDNSLGVGGFAVVIGGKHKIDEKIYAIKMIPIVGLDSNDLRIDFNKKIGEIKLWSKLEFGDCVQYRSAWLERDEESRQRLLRYLSGVSKEREDIFRKAIHYAVLNIQMDYCWFSLKDILIKIMSYFGVNNNGFLSPIAYYISSELFVEILEVINRLHTDCMPLVIHRDIKSSNILIKYSPQHGFVKLADFGLAVEHKRKSQSHSKCVGTARYMAPEVIFSRKYNEKADIYSIGIMLQELFNFDINHINDQLDIELLEQYKCLKTLIKRMTEGTPSGRPSCREIIEKDDLNGWALSYHVVRDEVLNTIDINRTYNGQERFVEFFLKIKNAANNNN
ncbi:interferon-induced, double-stranded RNA-activated protein kinase-like [Oppia nitens]|uniref:interferon-induced, double-stranded RNA-activated protein kinase-like n=1 Tax=Oppia nitens TaxID=1686743 RepID=UPI0023D98988|nr:interferon-induced, double-stranded RNA-activated protein kinase-like [Oppia nitens]